MTARLSVRRQGALAKHRPSYCVLKGFILVTLLALVVWEMAAWETSARSSFLVEHFVSNDDDVTTTHSWKEPVVTWTAGGRGRQQHPKKRGILLLRATKVPIPEVYQKAFGQKGKPHDKLILELVASIRQFSPTLPVVVVVDEEPAPELLEVIDGYIQMSFHDDDDEQTTAKAWREKIPALMNTPFEETLYLDTDMKVCHDVEPLYDPLQSSEMAFVRVVPQQAQQEKAAWNRPIYRFDFYGCFILYRKTQRVHKLFTKAQTYDLADQEAINSALQATSMISDNDLLQQFPNLYTYPASVSAICRPNDLILPVNGPVYTIHGIQAQCGTINSYVGSRYLRCARGAGTFEVLLNGTDVHDGLLLMAATNNKATTSR